MTDDQELRQLIVSLLDKQAAASGDGEAAHGPVADGSLDLSSLELVRLLVSLEEHLDVELDDADIMNANFETVDDIVGLVSRSLAPSGRT